MAKKSKTPKLPKSIGGVKIPKELRETGGRLLAKANSPEGRQAIAAGLTMAAAAATAAAARHRTAAPRPPAAPLAPAAPFAPAASTAPDAPEAPPPTLPGEGGTVDPQMISDAIGQAADALIGRLFGARRSG